MNGGADVFRHWQRPLLAVYRIDSSGLGLQSTARASLEERTRNRCGGHQRRARQGIRRRILKHGSAAD